MRRSRYNDNMKNVKNKLPTFEPLMDLNIVALLLGCSVSTVTRLCDEGVMPHIVVARHRRKRTMKIRPSALSAFLAGNTSRPPEGRGGTPPVPPLLPPLAEIRPGVFVGFNGMPLSEPPFVSQGETVEATQEGGQADAVTYD